MKNLHGWNASYSTFYSILALNNAIAIKIDAKILTKKKIAFTNPIFILILVIFYNFASLHYYVYINCNLIGQERKVWCIETQLKGAQLCDAYIFLTLTFTSLPNFYLSYWISQKTRKLETCETSLYFYNKNIIEKKEKKLRL